MPASILHRLKSVFDELRDIYNDPARTYHNMDHINGMLKRLDKCRHLAKNYTHIQLVIWFHDAVYNSTRNDNEINSAALWCRKMSMFLDHETLEWGKLAILATIDHLPNDDPDIQILLDLDLAPLGIPYKEFLVGTANVRAEYKHVSEKDFKEGRKAFLGKILQRPRIYETDFWHDQMEDQAQENLRRVVGA